MFVKGRSRHAPEKEQVFFDYYFFLRRRGIELNRSVESYMPVHTQHANERKRTAMHREARHKPESKTTDNVCASVSKLLRANKKAAVRATPQGAHTVVCVTYIGNV